MVGSTAASSSGSGHLLSRLGRRENGDGGAVAPRSIWNGTITFGLVNVPVKLYTATESKSIHFHLVHARDGSRVENKRICSKEDKEVPYKQVIKGYEVSEDKYVVLEKDEIKAAAGDRAKGVHLEAFPEAAATDPG